MTEKKTGMASVVSPHVKQALAVLAALLVAFIISRVAAGEASTWRRNAASDQAQASKDQLDYRIGERARLDAVKLERQVQAMQDAVPPGEDQPSFVLSLSNLATSCSATWSSSSWSVSPTNAGPVGSIPWSVQVNLAGTNRAVLCMLRGMPGMPRAVEVTDVSLSYEPGGFVQAAVSLDAFSQASSGAS